MHLNIRNFKPVECLKSIEDNFLKLAWNEVYDFLEFIFNNLDNYQRKLFVIECNKALERENSAYRFVGAHIAPITSEVEILSLENAIFSPYKEVSGHIDKALALYSSKTNPDYQNSIKESISAVEALAKIISKDDKSLGKLLDRKEFNLHPALCGGLKQIYGYASDASGIRHSAVVGGEQADAAEALFMMVVCSASVHLIMQRNDKRKK